MCKFLRKKPTPAPVPLKNPVCNPACTEFEVDLWTLSDFVVHRLVPVTGTRPFPLNEQLMMCGALCRFAPTHLFEWGTHHGCSARIFYETAAAFSLPTVIHSIDLPPDVPHGEHPGEDHARLVRHIPAVRLYRGDGWATALSLAEKLPPASSLMFFVDGDHEYASVHRELSGILERFPSAIVLLHDTFYQSAASSYNIGPYLAIRDAVASVSSTHRVVHTHGGLPGMTLIHP